MVACYTLGNLFFSVLLMVMVNSWLFVTLKGFFTLASKQPISFHTSDDSHAASQQKMLLKQPVDVLSHKSSALCEVITPSLWLMSIIDFAQMCSNNPSPPSLTELFIKPASSM